MKRNLTCPSVKLPRWWRGERKHLDAWLKSNRTGKELQWISAPPSHPAPTLKPLYPVFPGASWGLQLFKHATVMNSQPARCSLCYTGRRADERRREKLSVLKTVWKLSYRHKVVYPSKGAERLPFRPSTLHISSPRVEKNQEEKKRKQKWFLLRDRSSTAASCVRETKLQVMVTPVLLIKSPQRRLKWHKLDHRPAEGQKFEINTTNAQIFVLRLSYIFWFCMFKLGPIAWFFGNILQTFQGKL